MHPLSSGPLRRETPSWAIARSGEGRGFGRLEAKAQEGCSGNGSDKRGGEGGVLIRLVPRPDRDFWGLEFDMSTGYQKRNPMSSLLSYCKQMILMK